MSLINKTKTWTYAEASEPTVANGNGNFDTLYSALTTGGQVAHVDSSQAFSSLAIFPAAQGEQDQRSDVTAVSADYTWQHMFEAQTGTACWLHAGAHAHPAVSALWITSMSAVVNSTGFGLWEVPLPIAYATDILSVVVMHGDDNEAGFAASQVYLVRAGSSLGEIHVVLPSGSASAGVPARINLLVVGW